MSKINQALQSLVDCVQFFIPRKIPALEKLNQVKIVSHRGCHDNRLTLENTMVAFEKALEKNLFGIEFDVRWTRDHVPMIHHDVTLKRLFKSNELLKDLTFSDVRKKYPLIPSLEEVVVKFGGKIHFFVELKKEEFPELELKKERLNKILSPLKPGEDFHIFGLFDSVLLDFLIFDKKHYLTISTTNTTRVSATTIEQGLGGITGHYLLLSNKHFIEHKKLDHKVGTGFPRNKSALIKEINRGVDFIFTNHADSLLQAITEMKKTYE